MNNKEYAIWLIEDDAKTIGAFSNALLRLGGEITVSTGYHRAFRKAPQMMDCGMIFVDNTLGDEEDVGPALVSRIKALNYQGIIVSNSFGRLKNPIFGTDMAFPKDQCTSDLVVNFIVQNYPDM